jgi:Zn-dependent peptidase ImmA (M78 family)
MPRKIGAVAAAEHQARKLLRRFGVRAANHICVEAFAARLGVEIQIAEFDGAAAQLVRAGDHTRILLNGRLTDPGLRRFSIAHELGHLTLGHPTPSVEELCSVGPGQAARGVSRKHEAEANAFAAELLMPSHLLRDRCAASPPGLQLPEAISDEFRVSVVASTIRVVELNPAPCAVVMSEGGKVRWSVCSSTFAHPIRRRRAVSEGSAAWDYFTTGAVTDAPRAVPASAWIDVNEDKASGVPTEIIEHARGSAELGTVLSLLSIGRADG